MSIIGAPCVEDFIEYDYFPEDWKENALKEYNEFQKKFDYSNDEDSVFTKWYIILTRIAFCLEEADKFKNMENPYREDFNRYLFMPTTKIPDELKHNFIKVENDNDEYKCAMKDEAMDLIKKYFYNLWD